MCVYKYRENLGGLTQDLEVHKTNIENIVNTQLTTGILFKADDAEVSLMYQADQLFHDSVEETEDEFNDLLNNIDLLDENQDITDMDIGMDIDQDEEIRTNSSNQFFPNKHRKKGRR